jgi:hypothetical protein
VDAVEVFQVTSVSLASPAGRKRASSIVPLPSARRLWPIALRRGAAARARAGA